VRDRLANRVAVITGSTGGIGEGIARRLAAEGASVVVSGRRVDLGERVVHAIGEIGGSAMYVRTDVTVDADCDRLIEEAVAHFGQLDILVNNAAIFRRTPIVQMTADQWDHELAVNLRGAFLCSKAALPYLREQGGGSIVNIGSTMVYRGTADDLQRLAYVASKGGLLAMTKTMARALAGEQIRVNWVTVGWVATPGEVALRDREHKNGQAYLEERANQTPMGRLETSEEIAAGVAYLVSDEASHVTGCELNISGGLWV
jgi:NAD(P)-dependent dehydrogenase (short-subunit alcohol dehydrogenase family)